MRFSQKLSTSLVVALLTACAPNTPPADNGDNGRTSSVPTRTSVSSHSSSAVSSAMAQLPEGIWQYTSVGDAAGNVYVRGYATTETVSEPFCEQDCQQFTYVFFQVEETPNRSFDQFLDENTGNSYVEADAIGLGCVNEAGLIHYVNHTDEFGDQEYELSVELSEQILNSSEENPLVLHLTSYQLTGGSGAPACYSHITEVEQG